MKYLVQVGGDLCVAEATGEYKKLSDLPEITSDIQELLSAGVFTECKLVGDRCLLKDSFEIIVASHLTYPTQYDQDDVVSNIIRLGGFYIDRSFGDYTFKVNTEDVMHSIVEWAGKHRSEWTIVKKQEPEKPVAEKEEPALDMDMDKFMADISDSMVEPETEVANEQVAAETEVVEELPTPDVAEVPTEQELFDAHPEEPPIKYETKRTVTLERQMSELTRLIIPQECLGESYAFTEAYISANDNITDAFCIEDNWERRGAYWIVDVIPSGHRIIHSDKNQYTHEVPISDCL